MIKKTRKLFGQSPEKLAHLLTTCAGDGMSKDKGSTEQQKAELLRALLEEVLPEDPAVIESLPTILKYLYRELSPLAGESLGRLLENPETNVSLIKKIKDYSKKMSGSAESEVEHEASATIYYAAIASALVYHNVKITGYSYIELERHFSSLMENKWILPEMMQLFRQAQEICNKKIRAKTAE